MTKNTYLARSAGSAIAAALALASTPLLAQQAETAAQPAQTSPVIPTLPPVVSVEPAPVQAPTVVTPQSAPAPTLRSNPVVQELPVEEPAPQVAEEPAEEASADATQVAPVAAPANAPAAQVSQPADPAPATTNENLSATEPAGVAPVGEALPVAAPVSTAANSGVAPVDATVSEGQSDMASWVLGGAGALGLGLLALFLMRRRRNPTPEKVEAYKPVARRADPVPTSPPAKLEPVAAAPASRVTPQSTAIGRPAIDTPLADINAQGSATPFAAPKRIAPTQGSLATAGASVALPRSKPETVEERRALIDKLANAKSDRANPFRSMKARRRRARLIVQSLDNPFPNGSRIDLSQYPANWPHLARGTQAAAA